MKLQLFFLLCFLFLANSLEITPLRTSAVLSPCEQIVLPFQLNANGSISLEARVPSGLNYSLSSSLQVDESQLVNMPVLYPCDASPQTGRFAVSLTARQGSQATAATTYLFVSPASSLGISLQGEELACSCESTRFVLEIRNAGHKRETGAVLVSSQFPTTLPETTYDLEPGEKLSTEIVVDLDCGIETGAYPLSVALLKQGNRIAYAHSVVNIARCFASSLQGPANVSTCHGESTIMEYVLRNNGLFEQAYVLSTNRGGVSPRQLTIEPHSFQVFRVYIDPSNVGLPGQYDFELRATSEKDEYFLPISLQTLLCEGRGIPVINASFPGLENLSLFPGENRFSIDVKNDEEVVLQNAVLSINGSPVSDLFDLQPGESKNIPVVVDLPANLSGSSVVLVLESDQGRSEKEVGLETRSRATGLFVLGAHFEEAFLVGLVVAIVALLGFYHYAYHQDKSRQIMDTEISEELRKILAKHRR
ncbi:hypothetical protein HY571_01160 [Candidatus Micrarchaeota archaeon]|nr:hypothetical protein [Candidatus Micrarchaeota archaeon]